MTKTTPIIPNLTSGSRVGLMGGQRGFSYGRLFVGVNAKLTRVAPADPTSKSHDISNTRRRLRDTQNLKLSFFEAFGSLGLLMVLILLLSLTWTAWLILVALAPNEAANWLMDTGTYDNGQFWLIIDATPNLTRAAVASLMIVALCYLFVTLKMLFWRHKVFIPAIIWRLETRLINILDGPQQEPRVSSVVGLRYRRIHSTWKDFTSFNGKNRKLWVGKCSAWLLKGLLGTEFVIILFQLLKRGSPVELVYGYAVFVAANSLSCATNILSDNFSALTEVLIDSIFDVCAAVLFPIATLIFCYDNFEFDRDVYLTYLAKLLPGSFEHIGRLFVNQAEIALFRVSFDSLRFSSPLDLVVRITMNLVFCYRIQRMMEVMIWRRQHSWTSGRTMKNSSGTIIPVEKMAPVPKLIGAVFGIISVAVLMITQQSVSHSFAACSPYPECVVYTHRWVLNDRSCPCLIFVAVDKAPLTYAEWRDPIDVYDTLKAVSVSGRLESIQIINHQLLEFPEELQSCRKLKSIQLIYTSTRTLPVWTGKFSHLQTLVIEGKLGSLNLQELPDTLFSNMPNLAMVHLGVHDGLKRIPPLSGVPHLQSLSLAWMFHLHQLPSFDNIPDLRRLAISVVPVLEWIPDMSSLYKLVDFTIFPGIICCNGFIGACDLSNYYCLGNPFIGLPSATCLMNDTNPTLPVTPYLGSDSTKKAFEKFAPNTCNKWAPGAEYIDNNPTKEKIDMCAGKLFRECHLPGNVTGICYNMRFQVLSCIIDDSRIALRQYQIEKRVGPLCDPVEEKWLGCK